MLKLKLSKVLALEAKSSIVKNSTRLLFIIHQLIKRWKLGLELSFLLRVPIA